MMSLGDDSRILVEVDPELFDLVPVYLQNRAGDLERMQAAVERGDFDTVLGIAHNIQGSGGSFGFADLSEIGAALEEAARARARPEIERQLRRLEHYLARVEVSSARPEPAPLPIAPAAAHASRRRDGGGGPAILLVDDQEMNAVILGRYLEREGYSVKWLASGEAALADLAQSPPPALMLLDVVMPGMNGFEVCRRVKSSAATCGIPVVLVTSFDRRNEFLQGWAAGADDVLARPVRRDELLKRVRSLVGSARHATG
jgi:CheY-like chemotaxis protein